jgi:2-dehydropantoate 2-reductase
MRVNVAVMGAGAVGCYYGGMLARAGHRVVLIGRSHHVEAVRRDGLFMDTRSFQTHVPMQASTDASAVRGAKLVLCCVKSDDSESAAADMAPHLESETLVLSLQNGVDNAERLQDRLPCRVAPTAVYLAAEMAGPGQVKHHGRGELVIGPSSVSSELAKLFADAGVPVQISDNIAGALWAKLIINCGYNALSAITQLPYGQLIEGEGVQDLMRAVVQECLAVAQGDAVTVPADMWEQVLAIAPTMPGQLSSTAQDLARGKRSEINHLNGYVVRRGEALGIATPVNRTLLTLVRLLEGMNVRRVVG